MAASTLLGPWLVGCFVHVVLNMAASLDGRVAGPNQEPVTLSSPEDQQRVHRLRAASDAVIVGSGTVLNDDPRLTARLDPPPSSAPLRVVFDRRRRMPSTTHLAEGEPPTLVLTETGPQEPIGQAQVRTVSNLTPETGLRILEEEGVDTVLLEGGPTLAGAFLEAGLIDRFTLYVAPRILGEGPSLADAWEGLTVDLAPRARAPLGEGTLIAYGIEG